MNPTSTNDSSPSSAPADSRIDTFKHKQRVEFYLMQFCMELMRRANVHDDSKLVSPEVEGFNAAMSAKLSGMTYGSEEYKRTCETTLKTALDSHYAKNRHHPQFHPDGIAGMNLADLVEMFCDWIAATERQNDGNIHMSLEKNKERFKISDQLQSILENTVPLLEEGA